MTETRGELRSAAHPGCPVCGAAGARLHAGQRDRLFHAAGTWDTACCTGPGCDAVWLDPAPLAEDLPLAYADYYTHDATPVDRHGGRVRSAYLWFRSGYLARRYGYGPVQGHGLQQALGCALYLLPLRRAAIDEEIRQLHAQPGARLLDVGCGSGGWLARMQALGWVVQGLDFDAAAVREARARGLDIALGSLAAQSYADASFDAVTANHVIEHLPDALATLRECRRVLRPGGVLVLYTPNSASLGHAVFRSNWRGLEPPRHLQVFGPRSLAALLRAAGFEDIRVATANSEFYWRHSLALWRRGGAARTQDPRWTRAVSFALAVAAQVLQAVDGRRGESLVAHATRA